LAKCFVVVTHQQQIFDLKENPFLEFNGIINGVRNAVDAGNLVFHSISNILTLCSEWTSF
jgi:hypothetical protein